MSHTIENPDAVKVYDDGTCFVHTKIDNVQPGLVRGGELKRMPDGDTYYVVRFGQTRIFVVK